MTPDPAPQSEPQPRPSHAGAREEPRWLSWPNALTLLRVALVPVIAVLLVAETDTTRWWAFGVFVFAAFTDTVDGWLARRMVGVTRWGQLADPAADKALIVGALAALAWLGELPWWAVAVIVAREVAVTVQRSLLVRRGLIMPASALGKAKTVTQVVAVTLYLLPAAPRGLAAAVLGVAVVVTIVSGLEYALRGGRRAAASVTEEPR